jgi:ectoine hydroxylase-related dioxygenase (phytanoyl-CoA dioxygenase family)
MFELGFEVFENVLQESECDSIIEALDLNCSNRASAGLRNLMSASEIAEFAKDPRLIEIGRRCTGHRLIPYKATLFNKTGKANWLVAWHQDTALPVETAPESDGWGPVSIKSGVKFAHASTSVLRKILALRIHLDASTSDNGPLRVIPGSHLERFHSDSALSDRFESVPQYILQVGRGGVIAMSPLLVHASSKCVSDLPRRVLHIEYARSLEPEPGIRLAIA